MTFDVTRLLDYLLVQVLITPAFRPAYFEPFQIFQSLPLSC